MKKLKKLLALALAAVMLLSTVALAADSEGEDEGPKELFFKWLTWEEPVKVESDWPNNYISTVPGQEFQVMFGTCEWDDEGQPTKFTPIPADKLVASEGVTIKPLAGQAASNDKNKDCYVNISFGSYWDKDWGREYTISCEDYSMTVKAELPDVGFYSAPEAATDTYLDWWLFGTSPSSENESIYFISRATDETYGRHVINVELNKDHPENKDFSLEKINDNVYKLTRTCGINIHELRPVLDITWQEGEGGNPDPYVEQRDFFGWANSSLVISESEFEQRAPMDELKGAVSSEITLQAGESKEVYLGINYFDSELGKWVANWTNAGIVEASDSALTITQDTSAEYSPKATLRCGVPGTYTIHFAESVYWYPEYETMILCHADGKQYTAAEKQAFGENNGWSLNEDKELVIYNDEHPDGTSFEEAFPGDTIQWTSVRDPDFYPVTVTVESAVPAFTDVKEGAWYEPAVRFASGRGYMNGSNGKFNPEGGITGAEFSQLLYNKAGKPAAAEGAAFQSVAGAWYESAMLWAAGEGIITDAGDAAVEPEKALTRQQAALMLYNSLGKPEGGADLAGFSDAGQVSAWARSAMEWAVSEGVFKGSQEGDRLLLKPAASISRAEVAQLLLNCLG